MKSLLENKVSTNLEEIVSSGTATATVPDPAYHESIIEYQNSTIVSSLHSGSDASDTNSIPSSHTEWSCIIVQLEQPGSTCHKQ